MGPCPKPRRFIGQGPTRFLALPRGHALRAIETPRAKNGMEKPQSQRRLFDGGV